MNEFEKACNEIEQDFDGGEFRENAIEFLRNAEMATVNFSQGRYITKVKRLAEKFPEECKIVAENKDGSIVAHIPVKWVHISRHEERELTEEQKIAGAERLRKYRERKNGAL